MKTILALCLLAVPLFAQRDTRGDSAVLRIIEGPREQTIAAVTQLGARLAMHSDLRGDHILAYLTPEQAASLSQFRTFDAEGSRLARGEKVMACHHPSVGPLSQTFGEGWDGLGLGSASVNVSFAPVNWGAFAGPSQAEWEAYFMDQIRAWSDVAAIDFARGGTVTDVRNIHVKVGDDLHGDGYGFSGALAHAFPPFSFWPEPLMGNVCINNAFQWRTDASPWFPPFFLGQVVRHEVGHALGLGHLGMASVMSPYYNSLKTALTAEDIFWIRQLYASRGGTDASGSTVDGGRDDRDGTAPAALAVVASAPSSTSTLSVEVTGSITGGTPPYSITWSTPAGNGTAGAFPFAVPLVAGSNAISLTVRDSGGSYPAYATLTVLAGDGGRAGR